MDTIIGKRTICSIVWFVLFVAFGFRAYSQRAVTAEKLIAEAEKHLQVREETGNNDGYWVEKYLASTGLGKGYPWCAAFQSYVHKETGLKAPRSARVVDWFKEPLWERKDNTYQPEAKPGMVGALYYARLKRYGHILLIVGQDKNNYYTIEGNTNGAGSREGDGVYRKIRSKSSISALADHCEANENRRKFNYGTVPEQAGF